MGCDLNPNLSFPPLLILIVNDFRADLSIGCLRSWVEEVQALPRTPVVVGDNVSGNHPSG